MIQGVLAIAIRKQTKIKIIWSRASIYFFKNGAMTQFSSSILVSLMILMP